MGKGKYLIVILLCLFKLSSYGQVTIVMEEEGGVYKVPCKVNGLRLKFIFDTGASTVSMSSTVAEMMLENDYLSETDFLGSGYSQIANGNIVDHTKIVLREIEIGGLILKNVEAVVIHNQSAPLLLGQSAIQKLGKVTISGDKLSISNHGSTNNYLSKKESYSFNDIMQLYGSAMGYYFNGDYLLATEVFDELYRLGEPYLYDLNRTIFLYTIEKYASSLFFVDRQEEALELLLKYEEEVISRGECEKVDYYSLICKCAFWCQEYDMSIRYGLLTKSLSPYPVESTWNSIYWIASSYMKKGDSLRAQNEIKKFINEYLNFMEIAATDCWDKEYVDSYLANMYYNLALRYDSKNDCKKFCIIAAKWGDKDAIEMCKEFNWSYSNKPSSYVY